jgi:AcrR family transcriptional regulator
MSEKKNSLKSPEHIQAQKERIQEAAKKAFRECGFHNATMRKIAEYAGVSQGLAYRYFKNKDAIIETIIVEEKQKTRIFLAELKDFDDFINNSIFYLKMLFEPTEIPDCMDPVIYVELRSEANRNPEMERIIRAWDNDDMDQFMDFITRCYKQEGRSISTEALHCKMSLIAAIFDGFAVRIKSLSSVVPEGMEAELRKMLKGILDI